MTKKTAVDEMRVLKARILKLEAYALALERKIAESRETGQELLASEIRYRRLFESAKDGILILDAGTGKIVDVNPFLVELLSYSHDHFMGRALWEIGFFKDINASEAAFVELQEKGYLRYEDLPLKTRDGSRIEVEFVSNVYQENTEKVIQCNIRDITARKRGDVSMAANARKMQALLDLQLLSQAQEDKILDFALDACLNITESEDAVVGIVNEKGSSMTIHRWVRCAAKTCTRLDNPCEYPIVAAGILDDCILNRRPLICNQYSAPHPDNMDDSEEAKGIQNFVIL